jgi:hypothetical protein
VPQCVTNHCEADASEPSNVLHFIVLTGDHLHSTYRCVALEVRHLSSLSEPEHLLGLFRKGATMQNLYFKRTRLAQTSAAFKVHLDADPQLKLDMQLISVPRSWSLLIA